MHDRFDGSGVPAAAAAAIVALPACDSAAARVSARQSSGAGANVRVSHDRYGDHVGPSLAANPRHPGQLIVACQGSPTPPEFIATYLSFDGGASWPGGRPPQPAAGPAGDDVNVAFDPRGRGYICATRSRNGPSVNPANPNANRAVYVWRTYDGGRSFSEPATLVEGIYSYHPWLATGPGQTSPGQNVYVAWGAGASHTALDFRRSSDSGQTFEPPRRILEEASVQPNLAVDQAGRVAISAFALANSRINEVLLLSKPNELRFRTPIRVATASFDPLDQTTSSRGKADVPWAAP